MQPINISEYEILAKERMNPVFWDFYAGGSDDEITLRANQADFARIRLRPRILVEVNQCDTSTSVLGRPVPMPILVAPTSMHCLALLLRPCTVWLIPRESVRQLRVREQLTH